MLAQESPPSNNEMKQTKPAMARTARSSLLISVFCGLEVSVTRWQKISVVLVALVGLATTACGFPKDDEVRAAFLKENPTFTVTDVGSGEGDGSTVYKHIRYRTPGGTAECEVVWGYQEAEPTWRIFHKGEPGLAGTVCEGCARKPCA